MPYTVRMRIELSDQAEELVKQQLVGGQYGSADEVIEEALRRLGDDAEYWAEVGRMVEDGRQSLAAGRFTKLTPDLADRIKSEARARRDSTQSQSA